MGSDWPISLLQAFFKRWKVAVAEYGALTQECVFLMYSSLKTSIQDEHI
jgi:hypothetical protein